MKIHYNKDFECYMVAECHKTNVIELDGVQLIPMTELEKIKSEYEEIANNLPYRQDYYNDGRIDGLETAMNIMDNHISELKGENK